MNTYRIYTEDKNKGQMIDMASIIFPDGFTYWTTTGIWNGAIEDSFIIEVVGEDLESKIRSLAYYIKDTNEQQAVMVTSTPCEREMI